MRETVEGGRVCRQRYSAMSSWLGWRDLRPEDGDAEKSEVGMQRRARVGVTAREKGQLTTLAPALSGSGPLKTDVPQSSVGGRGRG